LAVKWNIQQPQDWFSIAHAVVMKEKGGSFVNNYYNGSLLQGNM
jgi:hypothetical protein